MNTDMERLATALAERYRIERELGQGGMATVYLAEDLRHKRKVALKVLKPELAAVLGAERFVQEITTTASLQHPHILPLFDSGTADGFLFYVMPFVDGETLRARLDRETQLPVSDALRIAHEVADALEAAHAISIVHRDIKPENILLQGTHALVADFGIALAVQSAAGARMTQTGLSLGTPQYMSPEQAMGDKQVDHRADIYALGAVTYEMLTGEPPHTGPTSQAIVAKLLTEPVRPMSVVRPAVAAHVDAALHVALEKLPADRFGTVREFSDALRGGTGARGSALMTASMGQVPISAQRRRIMVGGAVVAGAALAIGWALGNARRTSNAEPLSLTVPLAIPLASQASVGGLIMAISNDGSLLAVGASDSTNPSRLVIHSLADGRFVDVEPLATAPAFSPDARLLAYFLFSSGEVRVIATAGGAPRTLARGISVTGITWQDDSTLILSRRADGLQRIVLGRANAEELTGTLSDSLIMGSIRGLSRDLLLVSRGPTISTSEVGTYSVSDSTFRSLGVTGTRPMYVDPGIVLFLDQGTLWGLPVDPRTYERRGEPRALIASGTGVRVITFAVSRTGVLVVRRSENGSGRDLVISDRAGKLQTVRPERTLYRSVRWSPNGLRILYSVAPTASAGGDIYIANVADGTAVRVTTESRYLAPEWSRDGRRVMYVTRAQSNGGKGHILSVDPAGGGAVDTLLSRRNSVFEFELTADGSRLLWREDVGATARDVLSAAPGDGDNPRSERATRFDERGIALSPDGQWYVYTSTETGRSEVYLSRLGGDGARWPISRAGGSEPRWARNGEVFFRTQDSVYVSRVTLGASPRIEPPRALFADDSYFIGFESVWDVSTDGKRFVFVREEDVGATTLQLLVGWIERWRAGTR